MGKTEREREGGRERDETLQGLGETRIEGERGREGDREDETLEGMGETRIEGETRKVAEGG